MLTVHNNNCYEESGISDPMVQLLGEFRNGGDTIEQIKTDAKILDTAFKIGTSEAICFAGQMAMDIASRRVLSPGVRDEWVRYADNIWRTSDKPSKESIVHDKYKLATAIRLACVPLYRRLIVKEKIPTGETIKQSLADLFPVINVAAGKSYEIGGDLREIGKSRRTGIAGAIGELSVLALLNRYFAGNMGDESIVAVPSLLSEDRNRKSIQADTNSSWDISVFTHYPPDKPNLTNKVQVKTGKFTIVDIPYDDDIVVINPDKDLIMDKIDRERPNRKVLGELYLEGLMGRNRSTKILSGRLDKRAELALEILG